MSGDPVAWVQLGTLSGRPYIREQYDRIALLEGLLREAMPALDSFDDAWTTALAFRIRAALGEK